MRRWIAFGIGLLGCTSAAPSKGVAPRPEALVHEDAACGGGFRERAERGCADEASCDQLLVEARRREQQCPAAPQREEARAEAERIQDRLRRLQAERAEREASEAMARDPLARTQVDREIAEDERKFDVSFWIEAQMQSCRKHWSSGFCKKPSVNLSPAELEGCKESCKSLAGMGASAAFEEALYACQHTLQPPGVLPRCQLAVPALADSRFKNATAECTRKCRSPEGPVQSIPREMQAHCCDGTRSRTCRIGQQEMRCCLGHKGVCDSIPYDP